MPPKLKPAPLLTTGQTPALHTAQMDIEDVLAEMQMPRIIGYERVASGCAYCMKAGERLYHTGDLMPIHEHCTCGVAPVFEGQKTNKKFHKKQSGLHDSELGQRLDQTVDLPQSAIDAATADGGGIPAATAEEGLLDGINVDAIAGFGDNTAENARKYAEFLKQGKMSPEAVAEYEGAVTNYAGTGFFAQVQRAFVDGLKGATGQGAEEALATRDKLVEMFSGDALPPTTRDITVHRGLALPDYPEVGDIIESKALSSTSVGEGVAEASLERAQGGAMVILKGVVPKGSRVLNVDANFETKMKKAHDLLEGELVLPPNTKFKIVREAGESSQGYPVYEVEVQVGTP